MTERELQDAVLELATWLQWRSYHTHDSRRSTPGYPDLTLVSAARHRVLAVELKSTAGRLTIPQRQWLDDLAAGGVETHVWRPADWTSGTIEEALR